MKTKIILSFLVLVFSLTFFTACTKEEVKPKAEGGANAVRDKL